MKHLKASLSHSLPSSQSQSLDLDLELDQSSPARLLPPRDNSVGLTGRESVQELYRIYHRIHHRTQPPASYWLCPNLRTLSLSSSSSLSLVLVSQALRRIEEICFLFLYWTIYFLYLTSGQLNKVMTGPLMLWSGQTASSDQGFVTAQSVSGGKNGETFEQTK